MHKLITAMWWAFCVGEKNKKSCQNRDYEEAMKL